MLLLCVLSSSSSSCVWFFIFFYFLFAVRLRVCMSDPSAWNFGVVSFKCNRANGRKSSFAQMKTNLILVNSSSENTCLRSRCSFHRFAVNRFHLVDEFERKLILNHKSTLIDLERLLSGCDYPPLFGHIMYVYCFQRLWYAPSQEKTSNRNHIPASEGP